MPQGRFWLGYLSPQTVMSDCLAYWWMPSYSWKSSGHQNSTVDGASKICVALKYRLPCIPIHCHYSIAMPHSLRPNTMDRPWSEYNSSVGLHCAPDQTHTMIWQPMLQESKSSRTNRESSRGSVVLRENDDGAMSRSTSQRQLSRASRTATNVFRLARVALKLKLSCFW
jgi:hypothetical protein